MGEVKLAIVHQYAPLTPLRLENILKLILGHRLINIGDFTMPEEGLTFDALLSLGIFRFEPQGSLYYIRYLLSYFFLKTFRE